MKKSLLIIFGILISLNIASAWWNTSYSYSRNNSGTTEENIILPINNSYGTNMVNSSLEQIYCVIYNATSSEYSKVSYNNENDTICNFENSLVWKVQTQPVTSETGTPLSDHWLYLPFDEYSGEPYVFGHAGGYYGTNNGADIVEGKIGKGLFFNSAEDDYVNTTWIPPSDFIDSNHTFAFWFKQNSSTQYGALTGIKNVAVNTTHYWYIYMPYSTNEIRYRYVDHLGNSYIADVNNDTIRDGNWHFITITADPNNQEFFVTVDGVQQTVSEPTQNNPSIVQPDTHLLIGRYGTFTTEDLNATAVDDFKIFNRSLTDSEIQALYTLPTSVGAEEEQPTTTTTIPATTSTTTIPATTSTTIPATTSTTTTSTSTLGKFTETLTDVGEGTGNFINSILNPVVNIIFGFSVIGLSLFIFYTVSTLISNAFKGRNARG